MKKFWVKQMCTGQVKCQEKKRAMSTQGYVPLGPSATADEKCEHAQAFVVLTISVQRRSERPGDELDPTSIYI